VVCSRSAMSPRAEARGGDLVGRHEVHRKLGV
jgi:hypothetical protein